MKITIQANTTDQLIIKCDDHEQNSRRSCLRVHGIKCSDDERNEDEINLQRNESSIPR